MPKIEKYKTKHRPSPIKAKVSRREENRQAFYQSPAWRKLRINQLYAFPFCEVHEKYGVLLDVTDGGHIDHIIPWDTQGGARLDERNLTTLCISCHGTKTMWERSGYLKVTPDPESREGEYIPAEGEKERIINKLLSVL